MQLIKRIILFVYVVMLLVLAAATFIEYFHGTSAAACIYHHVFFIGGWGILALLTLWILYRLRMWKRMSVFLLHFSFVVILAGALITFLTGTTGDIHLRIGTSTFQFVEHETNLVQTLPFRVELDTFRVEHYPDTEIPSDYVSSVRCTSFADSSSIQTDISMNNVLDWQGYRFYQSSYDDDWGGSWLGVNYDPWGTTVTYLGYLILGISMMAFMLKKRNVVYILLLGITLLIAYLYQMDAQKSPLLPVLSSPLLGVHVSFIMVAYTLLGIISLNGVIGLFLSRKEEKLMTISRFLLYPAVVFLGIGIFVGAVWASISWGRYWAWDPKEVWALITFMVYGLAFHSKSFPSFSCPRFFHIYMIVAILTVVMTYLGVNHLLGGMHSYG